MLSRFQYCAFVLCILGFTPSIVGAFTSESYTIDGYRMEGTESSVMYSSEYSISGVTVDPLPESEEEDPETPTVPDTSGSTQGSRGRSSLVTSVTTTVPTAELLYDRESQEDASDPGSGFVPVTAYSDGVENVPEIASQTDMGTQSLQGDSSKQKDDLSETATVINALEVPFSARLTVLLLVVLGLIFLKRYTVLGKRWLPF